MTYFCACFVCGSLDVCGHREPELVIWWLAKERESAALARETASLAAQTPPEVSQPTLTPAKPVTSLPSKPPLLPGKKPIRWESRLTMTREDALARRSM